jgi:hypothetical protein
MNISGTNGNDILSDPGPGGTLSIVVSGQGAEGVPPMINLLVNGVAVISNVSVTADHNIGQTQIVSASIPAGTSVTSVAIQYTNDTVSPDATAAGQDRNIYLSSVTLDGSALDASSATYARTLNGAPFDTIAGTFEMKWGGTQTFSGSAVTTAAAAGGSITNDTIDGLAGVDTMSYSGARAEYSFSESSAGHWTVTHGSEVDSLANVERLQFSDMHHALDMEAGAGTVAKLIATLWGESFLSSKDFVGIGLSFADQGYTASQLAAFAVGTVAFQQRAGSTSNTDFVHTVAANVGYGGDVTGYIQELDSGATTKADLAVMASNYMLANASALNHVTLMGVMHDGIDYV